MSLLLIIALLLASACSSYPVYDVVEKPSHSQHHHHHKHHIRHKHRRRSLASDEDTKTQRNKQIMLTKPYWPWP
ncbi:unnamed protein product [Caenorhabditis bovis]|uniref:Secreted protein n=1 Tax=Caenorhabditis bovis TaxID=2654633 RepID=A0A8S1F5A5_9PELO|nr:unnamed protein product [Caenorhabditis bovis]